MTATATRPTRPRSSGGVCTAQRHGTHTAYDWWGCRCPEARDAWRIYRKRLRFGRQPAAIVPAVGTVRRLQALVANGYGWSRLSALLGVTVTRAAQIGTLPITGQVNRRTAERVRALYAELSETPGGDRYALTVARRRGYHPPITWDDDTIDDPNAEPNYGDTTGETDEYDPITVGLAIDGHLTYDQLSAHRPDLIEAVRRLARDHTDRDIAEFLRWPGRDQKRRDGSNRAINTITKLRLDHGIPPCTQRPKAA